MAVCYPKNKTFYKKHLVPHKMYGHSSAFDHENQKLYLFGGIAGLADTDTDDTMTGMENSNLVEWSNDFFAVDLHEKTVEKIETSQKNDQRSILNPDFDETFLYMNSPPEARMRAEMVYYDRKLFLLGGNSRTVTLGMDRIDYYDILRKTWVKGVETKPEEFAGILDYPRPRCRFGHALYKKRYLFIVGGEDLGNSDGNLHKDCWRLDLKTLQWNFVANLPVATTFLSCAITDEGCLYRNLKKKLKM